MKRFRKQARGFTMIEVLIGVGISTLIMLAIYSTQRISGTTIKSTYGQTRTRAARMQALDQIRYRLADAQIGSVQEFEADFEDGELIGYHRIEFTDPTNGGVTSSFEFDPDTDTLFYDDDTGDGNDAVEVTQGPINIVFQIEQAEIVRVWVKTESIDKYVTDVDSQDGETKVYLRNIP